jgi:hypothetical protein
MWQNRITPVSNITMDTGISMKPAKTTSFISEKVTKDTPVTRRLKAVRMYARKVRSFASTVLSAARKSRKIKSSFCWVYTLFVLLVIMFILLSDQSLLLLRNWM